MHSKVTPTPVRSTKRPSRTDNPVKSVAVAPSVGLLRDDFTCIAKKGFGDGYNGVAHSGCYFNGKVYVGTSRANLHMIAVNKPPSTNVWPVRVPDNVYDLDRRAQIWCFDPATEQWSNVYTAPWIPAADDTQVPQDIGYRGQVVFQGPSDTCPTLYVCTWSPSKGGPPQLLRSIDGLNFERLGVIGSGDKSFNTFRTLYPYKNKLFTSPTGSTKGYGQATDCMGNATIYVTADPVAEPWVPANEPGFGDPGNLTVFEMVEFNGHLYAGTLNATTGYQIWKTKAAGKPPYRWAKVLDHGAYRGKLNEMAVSMIVFNNALYVGSGIQNGGVDKVHHIGPAGAELIRIHPDDSWDLIVGSPRDTPQGRKEPLSEMGPGFSSLFNAHIWRGVVHDGWLYLATYNWIIFLPYLSGANWPQHFKKRLAKWGVHNLVERRGGFDLWRSQDGVHWRSVSLNGFNNPYNYGIRTMLSTPDGMFLGTANTFGPEIATKLPSGDWVYTDNPSGGVEVWRGVARKPVVAVEHPAAGVDLDIDPHESTEVPNMENHASTLSGQAQDLKEKYDERMYDSVVESYYEGSGFYSWGYWDETTTSQKQACINMVERLLSYLPKKKGNILDVACGRGATTRCLLPYYEPHDITGTDISDKLMESCRANVPGARFLVMDAVNMDFPDASFDNILCVDGAGLFDTRERFFQEAYRLLKPNGRLLVSDRLVSKKAVQRLSSINRDNYVRNLDEYRALYERNGYRNVMIEDVTPKSLWGYTDCFSRFIGERLLAGDIDDKTYNNFMAFILSRMVIMRYYVFVSAQK